MTKVYLDGCSMVWGAGLEPKEKLEYLLQSNHNISIDNFSQSGKSNHAISIDIYNNFEKYDAFIIGFTWADRFSLGYENGQVISIGPNFAAPPPEPCPIEYEKILNDFHKTFYKLYDIQYWENYSDMLIDSMLSLLEKHDKKVFAFTWEKRKTKLYKLSNIGISVPYSRQSDRHLDAKGMELLYNNIVKNFSGVLN